jgi:hypothetical protein
MRYLILIYFFFQSSILIAQHDHAYIADSLLKEATHLKKENQYNNALKCYLQALKLSEKDTHFYKKLHLELGQFYYDWGLYDKAIEYILHAGSFQLNSDENLKAVKLLALSYDKSKKYDLAIVHYKDLYSRYHDKTQLKSKASVLVSMAAIYKKTNQYPLASTCELENLELRKVLKDTVGMYVALNNLGATYKNLNDNNKALEYFTQSYTLSKLVGEEIQMGVTLMNIGLIHQLQSNHNLAVQNLQLALAIFQKKQKKFEIGQVCNSLGAIYFVMREYNKARNYALLALTTAKQAKILEIQSTSYKLLSRIYKSKNMLEESYKYLQQHAELKDSMLLIQMVKDQEFAQKYLEIENKETQIKDLLIDKELKELQVKKLNLEKDTKNKEWEILKRDNELQEITHREQQLRKEKELHLLILREQSYKMEANAKQIALLHQQKEFEEQKKLNKLKELDDKAKINALQLKNQKVQLEKQDLYKNILIVLLFLIPIIGFLIFRVYAYRQNAINSKLMHRTLDLEQRMLRAQMNPHFIFNAMNSIQSFVSTNDSYSAEKYLARFSRLMRYILENSSKQYVCLDDELTMLKLYIELEQLRFDNKFKFEFNVARNIDSEFIYIPPMLTQPYIENAIVHGLCNKPTSDGFLSIRYEIEDNVLICVIKDNGVGRKYTSQLKVNQKQMHKSMGMQVTKERFDMLGKTNKLDFSSVITDLYDENGNANGTEVKLRITCKDEEAEHVS